MISQALTINNIKKGLKNPTRILDNIILDYICRTPMIGVNSYHTIGTNVFDKDWDVLILLDTARVDAIRSVSDEYDFIGNVESICSVGGASTEWLARTFDKEHASDIQNTAFLSAQSHVQEILDTKVHTTDSDRPIPFKTLRTIPSVDIDQLGKAEYLFKFETIGEEGPFGHTHKGTHHHGT